MCFSVNFFYNILEEDRCMLAIDSGTGAKRFKRFYFNPTLKICEQFQYNGRGGNLNNFDNLAECRQYCPGRIFFLILYFIFLTLQV